MATKSYVDLNFHVVYLGFVSLVAYIIYAHKTDTPVILGVFHTTGSPFYCPPRWAYRVELRSFAITEARQGTVQNVKYLSQPSDKNSLSPSYISRR